MFQFTQKKNENCADCYINKPKKLVPLWPSRFLWCQISCCNDEKMSDFVEKIRIAIEPFFCIIGHHLKRDATRIFSISFFLSCMEWKNEALFATDEGNELLPKKKTFSSRWIVYNRESHLFLHLETSLCSLKVTFICRDPNPRLPVCSLETVQNAPHSAGKRLWTHQFFSIT